MRSYLFRLANALQASAIVPGGLRPNLLRLMGLKLPKGQRLPEGIYFHLNNVSLGEGAMLNVGCHLDSTAPITIGERVRIGPGCHILTGSHQVSEAGPFRRETDGSDDAPSPITIERGCWIGGNVTILPGVTIREGCVIGAGSVVTRDTEPNGVYVGAPLRRVRQYPMTDNGKEAA